MRTIKKLMMVAVLVTGVETAVALPSIRLETAPTENEGAIEADDLGPTFSRPMPAEEAAKASAPKVETQNKKKNDILSLFQDNSSGEKKEVNPLEEEANNELKMAAGDPENRTGNPLLQLGENTKQAGVEIKQENAPKEIELDTVGDTKNLPGLK